MIGDADKYFRPFALAIETKTSRMRVLALEAIEKMVCA